MPESVTERQSEREQGHCTAISALDERLFAGLLSECSLNMLPTVSPRTISRDRILEAAEAVVRARGYARATTKEIARVAGCSEGTLYNHFADKQELFVVCTVDRNPQAVEMMLGLRERAGAESIAKVLGDLLRVMGDLQAQLVPVLASLWADPELMARHKEFVHAQLPEPMRGGPIPLIADYLRAEQQLGRVREDLEPVALATMLMAIPFSYALWDHSGFARDLTPDRDRYFDDAIRALVAGLTPPRSTPPRTTPPRTTRPLAKRNKR